MTRIVVSKVRVPLPAREAWRARGSLELEKHIAALSKRKLTLLEQEVVREGASDEQTRRLARCELTDDFLGGSIMGVKTSDLGSEIESTHFTHLFDEAHGAEFSVEMMLKRINLSMSGHQWCLPESDTSCFLCTRIQLDARIPGLGGLIEMQLERQLRASHQAFPAHACTFVAASGAQTESPPAPAPPPAHTLAPPMPPVPTMPPAPPAPPERCGTARPALGWWRMRWEEAIARGIRSIGHLSTGRRHAVLHSPAAPPDDTVPVRMGRRQGRLLLLCGCAKAIIDSDEIIE